MSVKPVKVALIGSGNISYTYLNTLVHGGFQIVDVVGCSDLIPEKSAARAQLFGIRQMTNEEILSDPEIEIVLNTTQLWNHTAVTKMILEAGKHVYSEKAMGDTLEGAKANYDLARSKGLMLGCAPDIYMGAAYQTARKLIDDGAIGRPLPATPDGRISAGQIEDAVLAQKNDVAFEHIVQPKMVYISQPTENGGLYSKAELTAISEVCRTYGLYLYVDGARLGYGLAAPANDVTLADLCALTDVFYIGGTKVGALFGEAVVFANREAGEDFRYHIKQRGGMLAKGRLLGIQFDELFTNGLYMEISKKAVEQALTIAQTCRAAGFPLLADSPTNQQFPIFPDAALEKLGEKYAYSYWTRVDASHSAVRLCTSWATKDENAAALCADILALGKQYA